MKRFFRTAGLVLAFAVLLGMGSSAVVRAAPACSVATNPLACACSANADSSQSAACSTDGTKDPLAGPDGVIKKVTLLLAILAGIAAVIIIIVSGFRYITSAGDAQKAASARNGIIGAAVGLAIIGVSTSIVIFVVSRL